MIKSLAALLCLASPVFAASHGSPYANTGTGIATNLGAQITPGTSEQPYLNVFKTGGGWYTLTAGNAVTGEETYLYNNNLDANGYPTTLTGGPTSSATGTITGHLLHVSAFGGGPALWSGGTVTGGTIAANTTITSNNAIDGIAITVSNPSISMPGSNLAAGTQVQLFANGGTLATGFVDQGTYFVIATGLTANAFELSATLGGGAITPTGTQTGSPTAIAFTNTAGGIGTYTVNASQSVASTTITETHTYTKLSTAVMVGQAYYSGNWIFEWDNTGTFVFGKDIIASQACALTSHPNRMLLTSNAAGAGISVTLATTGAGAAYAQNMRLIYSPDSTCGSIGTREASYNSGEMFNPDFITKVKPFKVLRFIDWMVTVASTQGVWANRPLPNWVFWDENTLDNPGQAVGWTGQTGAPMEVMAQLCVEINAHCWFNMPHAASDNYITNFAAGAYTILKSSGLKVYPELSDELWNSGGSFNVAYSYVDAQAIATFGGDGTNGHYNWQGMRQAQVGILWKAAWGADASRVINPIPVQGGQSPANISGATGSGQLLTTPLWTGTGVPLVYTASIDNGSGGSGNILHVTAVTSGAIAVGSPVYDTSALVPMGTTVTAKSPTVACGGIACTGTGGIGTYAISSSVLATSEGMIGGGGTGAGGPAQPNFDAIAVAPYFGYGPINSWTASPTGGLNETFTEMFQGGLIPTGSSHATVTGGPTAFVVATSGTSCAASLQDQCTFALQVPSNTLSGTPTLAVDGAAAKPLQYAPNLGSLTTIDNVLWCTACGSNGNGVIVVSYMAGPGAWVAEFWLGYPGGMLKQMSDTEATWGAYAAGLSPPLPQIGYEGGQGFSGNLSTAVNTLVAAMQLDPRMAQANAYYLQSWKANGGQFLNYYNSVDTSGNFGYWGSLTNILANQPKYQGLLDFGRRNPCWWAGCR